MKRWLVLILTAVMAMVLAACTANESAGEKEKDDSSAEEQKEKVLLMNNGEEPTSLDPPVGFDAVSWNVLNNLMEGLTRLGKNDTPEPAMAEDWDISEDGKTYTFHLREDASWSNGDEVVADDFVYAWTEFLSADSDSPAAFLGYFIEGGEAFNNGEGSADDLGITAKDDKTFEVQLESPTGYFLHIISNPAFFPVNKKVAEADSKWHAEADSYVSNGPFALEEWEHNKSLSMVKNEEYWDKDTVNLDGVEWAMVDSTNTEYQMFENGELDVTDIPSDLADQLIDGDNVVIEEQAGLYFYRFNVNEEPFQNEKIRKAFATAVNQEEVVDFVTKNKEEDAHAFVSPGFPDPDGTDFREAHGEVVEFDPDEAKQLLEEGMEEEGYDELPSITLTYSTDDEHKAIAETLQNFFSDHLDVDIELENMEWNVFLDDQKDLKHQLSQSSFLFDYADPVNFLESFTTDSTMNRTGWSDEQYDDLIADIKSEADEEKRWDEMAEAEQILADQMPIFPIHYYNEVQIYQDNISGVVRHPVGYVELKWTDKE